MATRSLGRTESYRFCCHHSSGKTMAATSQNVQAKRLFLSLSVSAHLSPPSPPPPIVIFSPLTFRSSWEQFSFKEADPLSTLHCERRRVNLLIKDYDFSLLDWWKSFTEGFALKSSHLELRCLTDLTFPNGSTACRGKKQGNAACAR